MANELNQSYNRLSRSLKNLSIILIDEYDAIRSGDTNAIMVILRKLLFNTSPIIVKVLKNRSCNNSMNDVKTVIGFFDFTRTIMKKPAGISMDQWFSNSLVKYFLNQKLSVLASFADYIFNMDPSLHKNRTAFVKLIIPQPIVVAQEDEDFDEEAVVDENEINDDDDEQAVVDTNEQSVEEEEEIKTEKEVTWKDEQPPQPLLPPQEQLILYSPNSLKPSPEHSLVVPPKMTVFEEQDWPQTNFIRENFQLPNRRRMIEESKHYPQHQSPSNSPQKAVKRSTTGPGSSTKRSQTPFLVVLPSDSLTPAMRHAEKEKRLAEWMAKELLCVETTEQYYRGETPVSTGEGVSEDFLLASPLTPPHTPSTLSPTTSPYPPSLRFSPVPNHALTGNTGMHLPTSPSSSAGSVQTSASSRTIIPKSQLFLDKQTLDSLQRQREGVFGVSGDILGQGRGTSERIVQLVKTSIDMSEYVLKVTQTNPPPVNTGNTTNNNNTGTNINSTNTGTTNTNTGNTNTNTTNTGTPYTITTTTNTGITNTNTGTTNTGTTTNTNTGNTSHYRRDVDSPPPPPPPPPLSPDTSTATATPSALLQSIQQIVEQRVASRFPTHAALALDRVHSQYDAIIHRVVQGVNEEFLPLLSRIRYLEGTLQVLQREARTDPVNPYHHHHHYQPSPTLPSSTQSRGAVGGVGGVLVSPRAHPYHAPRALRQEQGGGHHLHDYHHRPVGY